jgi:RNase H-like domain found in reverse transcriptase
VLLAYPDFSKKFVIDTDASHYQLGAVISQDGKPIAFYSRKLNPAQTWYTTTERELLSIVETLKEYRNILLGHEIEVFTDHQNFVYKHFNTERLMRWQLLIEEFGPKLTYIKGENNIVADALSRMAMTEADFSPEAFAADEHDFPEAYPLLFKEIAFEQSKTRNSKSCLRSNQTSTRSLSSNTQTIPTSWLLRMARFTCLRSFRRRLQNGTTSTCVTREKLVLNSPWLNTTVG